MQKKNDGFSILETNQSLCIFLYRDTINVNGVDERSYIDYQSNKKIFSKDK